MKTKKGLSTKRMLSNNFFLLRLMFQGTPFYAFSIVVEAIRHNLVNFLEQTICVYLILDVIETKKPYTKVLWVVGLFLLLDFFAAAVSNLYEQKIKLKYLPIAQKKLKEMLYQKAGTVDLACYDDTEYYNDFMLSVSEADNAISRAEQLLRMIFGCLTVLLCYGTFFATQDVFSILFILVAFALRTIFSNMLNKWRYTIRQTENPLLRKREYVKRIFYLQQYAKELRLNKEASKSMQEEFDRVNEELYRLHKTMGKKSFLLEFTARYLMSGFMLDIVYVLYLIVRAVLTKTVSLSGVVVLYNSASNLRRGLSTVVDLGPHMVETGLYVEKIRAFLDRESAILNEKTCEIPEGAGVLECRNVSFGYNPDCLILRDVNLIIRAKEKVALVGYNGAGKTTLIKLLLRLYDPTEGEILLNGMNIRNYDIEEYRRYIGVVFQDFKLFAATVAENVVMDRVDVDEIQKKVRDNATENDVLEAVTKSGFSEKLASFPMGLQQELTREFSDKGTDLSGGEAQKLAVARAFYKNAGLVFLDEPSAALDPIAEYQLNRAMKEVAKEKTVLSISHRLSTTRDADMIYVMEQGHVIEQGSHGELLERGGVYATMWEAQASRYA
ncbi:MAG: ABC transporter ATP-binding protein [Lachnospiraceae bacterium]|nr:ABC transporter ATP-binding protein [Lachnospiraceae bacterium]